jgi:hypothetical protein
VAVAYFKEFAATEENNENIQQMCKLFVESDTSQKLKKSHIAFSLSVCRKSIGLHYTTLSDKDFNAHLGLLVSMTFLL